MACLASIGDSFNRVNIDVISALFFFFLSQIVLERRAGREYLYVLKFFPPGAST